MDEDLRIKIIGDIKDIKKSLDEVKSELKSFKKETQDSGKGVEKLNETLDENAKQSKKAQKANDDLTGSLKKEIVTAAAVTAVLAAGTDLILQLEEDTGLFAEALTGLSKEQIKSAEAQKELNQQIAKYLGDVKAEVFELESLVDIARDEARTKQERQNAINAINTAYPQLIKNLSLETIGTNDVDRAVQSLSNSLIRQAKIKGISDRLAKQYEALDNVLNQTGTDAATTADKILAGFQAIGSFGGFSTFESFVEEAGNLTRAEIFFELEKQIAKTEGSLKELLSEENFQVVVPDPNLKGYEKGLKDAQKLAEEAAKKLKKTFEDIDAAEGIIDLEKAAENARAVTAIYEESGARIKDALKQPEGGFDTGVDQVFQEILQLEKLLDGLEGKINSDTFNIAKGFNLQQLQEFDAEVKRLGENSKIFANSISQGIGGITGSLAQAVESDSELINVFSNLIVSTLTGLLQQLAQNAVASIAIKQAEATASGIQAASQTAAASGPLGGFLLPGLIAGAVAIVAGAFGGLKFAGGGIVPGGFGGGDRVPALLTSGEMILNGDQQRNLFNMLDNNLRRNTGGSEDITITGALRGDTIYLSNKRAERKARRFNS